MALKLIEILRPKRLSRDEYGIIWLFRWAEEDALTLYSSPFFSTYFVTTTKLKGESHVTV